MENLVVGQGVYMVSGVYGCWGRVVDVASPLGIGVKTTYGNLLRFGADGKGCDGNGTYECGPWELSRMLSEEEFARLEQARD